MRTKLLSLFLTLLVVCGCLRENFREENNVLSVADIETLTIDAEVLGADNVYDTLVSMPVKVLANRSWSAVIKYDGESSDWLELSQDESLILDDYTVEDNVFVLAKRNKTLNTREAKIIISEDADHVMTLPVKQLGQTRFISATTDREKALAVLDTINVAIACNTNWVATVDPSSTALISMDAQKGEDYSTLKVMFEENNDTEKEKLAVINLTAEGCNPYQLRITQIKGSPYVAFRMAGGVIPTEADRVSVNYAANVPWHMSVDSNENYPGCTLSKTEGDPTPYGTVDLILNHGKDPEVLSKSVTLKIWADGLEPAYVTFTQKGCLHLDFMDFDMSWHSDDHPKWWYQHKWPFETPTFEEIPQGSALSFKDTTVVMTTAEGYAFKVTSHGTTGTWFHLHQMGFIIGIDKNDTWIEFPGIPGFKLTKVIYEPPYTGGTYATNIRDVYGNAMSATLTETWWDPNQNEYVKTVTENTTYWKSNRCTGGNIVTREMHYNCTYDMKDTKVGEAYRLTMVYAGSINIKDLILIYEQ